MVIETRQPQVIRIPFGPGEMSSEAILHRQQLSKLNRFKDMADLDENVYVLQVPRFRRIQRAVRQDAFTARPHPSLNGDHTLSPDRVGYSLKGSSMPSCQSNMITLRTAAEIGVDAEGALFVF